MTVNWDQGRGRLTAISAWRYWDWKLSNDRDFTGLPVTTISAAPSKQSQWTQEVRYAGHLYSRANFLVGAFFFRQTLKPSPFHKQEQGSAAVRFLLAPSAAASTPGLLDGYGQQRNIFGHGGHFFVGFDASARSAYSSNASLSQFLIVDGYALVNTRIGFQARENWTFSACARNIGGKNYYELLSAAPGNSGLFVGLP